MSAAATLERPTATGGSGKKPPLPAPVASGFGKER